MHPTVPALAQEFSWTRNQIIAEDERIHFCPQNNRNASSGRHTMGSLSLKEVFRTTGTPRFAAQIR